MTKLNKFCVLLVLAGVSAVTKCDSTHTSHKPEARETAESKAPAALLDFDYKQSSLIDGQKVTEARVLLGYGTKEMNAWAVRTLKSIPRSDKNYATAQRLLATIHRDKRAEAKIEADLRTSRAADRRREASGEWSKERIELELAMHPERRERMAQDMLRMHDAIKELYGPEAALRFLQGNH